MLAVRQAEGLNDAKLKKFMDVLKNEEKEWAASSTIPKQKIYTLIVLRDNVMGVQKWYKNDKMALNNLKEAEHALDSFTEKALSNK